MNRGVSSSMELHPSVLSLKRDSHTSKAVVTLKGGKTTTARGKSNLSSQSKLHSANVSASGKPVIPKTPTTSSKLKGLLSARKQKSSCSTSFYEEGPSSASFSAQQFNSQKRRQKTVNSVDQQ